MEEKQENKLFLFPFSHFKDIESMRKWADTLCIEKEIVNKQDVASIKNIFIDLMHANMDATHRATQIFLKISEILKLNIEQATNIDEAIDAFKLAHSNTFVASVDFMAAQMLMDDVLNYYFNEGDQISFLNKHGITKKTVQDGSILGMDTKHIENQRENKDKAYRLVTNMFSPENQLRLTKGFRRQMNHDAMNMVKAHTAEPIDSRHSLLDENVDMHRLTNILADFYQLELSQDSPISSRKDCVDHAEKIIACITENTDYTRKELSVIILKSHAGRQAAQYLCSLPINSHLNLSEVRSVIKDAWNLADDYRSLNPSDSQMNM